MRACHVLGDRLCTIVTYAVGVNDQSLQSLIVFQGFEQLCDAHLSNAVLAKICCHTPAQSLHVL